MRLFNSLSDRIEQFRPPAEQVGVYVCGITPYDTTHLGHAFTYAAADVLIRYLKYRGWPVCYVQNVTDIDDDILKEAKKQGQGWRELGNIWTAHFIEDMIALNMLPPDHFPRATDVVSSMIEQIESLIETEVAYVSGGGVYFNVDAWDPFGKLSNLERGEMLPIANQRGNHPDDPNKRNPLDFVLWQPHAPGEPSWPSPWGPGRPGWHIECSTMATDLLGDTIDIHLGGSDLLFPHHECEIAQVEPVTGQPPFVRYWMHTAMVAYQGEKMSKSLGNLIMVRDLLGEYPADAIRLYLNSHHYRTPWEYPDGKLARSLANLELMKSALMGGQANGDELNVQLIRSEFEEAMDDDLNTPLAVEVLVRLAEEIVFQVGEGGEVEEARQALREMAGVLGLRLDQAGPEKHVKQGWREHLKRFPVPAGEVD